MHAVRFEKSGCTIHVAEGDLILSAALRAGVSLPYYCRRGECRSCRQKVRGPLDAHSATLTPRERAEGWTLLCVSHPRGDLVVDA